ncbi:ABC transporter permease subunit [Metamycoplasma buccale]|uniref:ABC transporter permease subunit n=1 Tax=Metamycoplasma buccale TaxID=55602 RepID=UPI00398EC454
MNNEILHIKNKKNNALIKNKTLEIFSGLFLVLVLILLVVILGSIFIEAIPGFRSYKWSIFGSTFNLNNNQGGLIFPLITTLTILILSTILASIISIPVAFAIRFRLNKKIFKVFKFFNTILASLPSVVLGTFGMFSLSYLIKFLGFKTSFNLITAILMLSFMLIPTILSFTLAGFNEEDDKLIESVLSLSMTKSRALYNIILVKHKKIIFAGIIFAFTKGLGESMALNFILTSQNYNVVFGSGFNEFWLSGLKTLGALISYNIFAENGTEAYRGILFVYALVLFILVMIINSIALTILNSKKIIKNKFSINNIDSKNWSNINANSFKMILQNYIKEKNRNFLFIFLEGVSILFYSIIVFWILFFIIVKGMNSSFSASNTLWQFNANSTGRALVNTIVIFIISAVIVIPFSLMASISISQYLKNKKLKHGILFILDAFNATPSIIFGLFGYAFFIQKLQISTNNANSNSLIVGILTISLYILPSLVRSFQQTFELINNDLAINAKILNIPKMTFIRKIIIPTLMLNFINVAIINLNKIIIESAPLYITAGLTSSKTFALNLWGQTLTTRIFAQLFSSNKNAENIMFESAFVILIFVIFLAIFINFALPYLKKRLEKKRK